MSELGRDQDDGAAPKPVGGSRVGCAVLGLLLLLGVAMVSFVVARERDGRRRFRRLRRQIKAVLIDAQSDCEKTIRAAWLESAKDNPSFPLIASKLPPARRSPVMSSGYAHSEESAEWGIKHLYADPDADFSKSSVSFNFPVTDISIRAVRGFAQTDFELLVIQHGRYPSNAIFLKALRKQLKKHRLRAFETRGPDMTLEEVWKELARLAEARSRR